MANLFLINYYFNLINSNSFFIYYQSHNLHKLINYYKSSKK